MTIEFDILKSNYVKQLNTSKFRYGKVGMIVIPILAIILTDIFLPNINLIVIGIIYLGLSYLLSKILQKSDEEIVQEISTQVIGTIRLEEDEIKIVLNENENQLNAGEISEININSYFGEVTGYGKYQELHYGTDTTIKLGGNNTTKILYVFIRNKEQRLKFKSISNCCLRTNSNYKEYTRNERTYNGNKLNYKEIQELKKDYQ